MNALLIPQPQMTVNEVLSNWPRSHLAFMGLKTKCMGCFLQKFCTLRDVTITYQIPFEELIGELEKFISTPITHKGVPNEKVA